MTSEAQIERYCVEQIKKRGGWALKYTSSTEAGLPDRLCIFPSGKQVWVEFKRPNRHTLDPLQKIQCAKLKKLNQSVVMINSFSKVSKLIDYATEKGWFK